MLPSDSPQGRLSKRKSPSIWARKSLKRSATAPSNVPGPSLSPQPPPPLPPLLLDYQRPPSYTTSYAKGPEMTKPEEHNEKYEIFHANQNHSASIIPDIDLPAWYNKDLWASVPPPMYKAAYRVHNPVGPRWYRNYHLIPPSQLRPAARPPSFFSPSFPPMGSNSLQERSGDSSRLAGPSRTPSGSPLPTPSSSQTRVTDPANKSRSRKHSLTTPDGVEIDITDPWGTTWHHPSPYDFGISPISSNSPTAANESHVSNRPRRASMAGYQVKRKAAPSPLSQSTSAVHLQPPVPNGPNVLRKPSKRKTPSIGSIFGSHSNGAIPNPASGPPTPIDNMSTAQTLNATSSYFGQPENSGSVVAPSSASIMTKTSKKEKRSSVLDRLAKKFSILRKSNNEGEGPTTTKDDWHHVAMEDVRYGQGTQPPVATMEPSDVEVGRNPPPQPVPYVSQEADRSSSISLEAPYPIGRLTVVNPDLPSSENTPAPSEVPLLPEQVSQVPAEPTPVPNVEIEHAISTSRSPGLPSSTILSNRSHDARSSKPMDITNPPPLQPSPTDDETPESLPPTPPAKSRAPSPVLPAPITPAEGTLRNTALDVRSSVNTPSVLTERQPTVLPPTSSIDASPRSSRAYATVHSMSDVPFPLDDDSILAPPRARFSYTSSSNCSPLSTTSMLVNPPTPYNPEMSMPGTPELPPPVFLARDKQSTNGPTSGKTTNKQTETFRLVRGTPSRVHGSTDSVIVAGQQWEVVETLESGKNKIRQSSRRDQEREKTRDGIREEDKEKETSVEREQEVPLVEAKPKDHPREKERLRDGPYDDRGREGRHHAEHNKAVEKESKKDRKEEREKERMREQKEREQERESQRQEHEKEKERHKDRERERERERREKEKEVERQKERERERERQREKERERQREKERERQKEKEREREREKERERERQREREREREREKERERQREREERHRERERERERQHEKEREKERAVKEREERERREREQRHEKERKREKERKKEKERDRREQARQTRHSEEHARAHLESSRHRTPSQPYVEHRHDAREGSPSKLSLEQSPIEARSNHRRSEDYEKARTRHPNDDSGAGPARPHLERNPSASTRPTSEYLSAADLVALRAKEAYEMERLFKARSLYGQELDGAGPNSIPSSNASEKGSSIDVVYGSGHTAYVVQTPFQSMRRPSNAPLPQEMNVQQDPSRPFSYLSDLEILSIPSLDSPTNRPRSNPLPEPPRSSAYQPTPLAILESNGAYPSDYWTKHTVTTAH